jgi:gluconokinase
MDERIAAGESAVVSCSALKRSYRDLLLDGRPSAWVVFLMVDRAQLERRLTTRHHFFPEKLLSSQLDALEPPGPDERAVVIEEDGGGPAATVRRIINWLAEVPDR